MNKRIVLFITALFITTVVFILEVKKEYREKQVKVAVPTKQVVTKMTTTTTTTNKTTTTTKKKTDADKYKSKGGKYYNAEPNIKNKRGK